MQFAQIDDDTAESLEARARGALAAATDAYNYLEDDDLADAAHDNVHRIGRMVGLVFGCPIEIDDGLYYDSCPVNLVHQRWGFSIGMTSQRLCSHCRQDFDDCGHLLDRAYPYVVSKNDQGLCSLCVSSTCGHVAGQELMAQPWATIADIDMHEVSVVRRPRDPLTRPRKIELDISPTIRDQEGSDLECTACAEPCRGFIDPWSPARAALTAAPVEERPATLAVTQH